MKPTLEQITRVVMQFEALDFFPRDSVAAKEVVIELLASMVSEQSQLEWLRKVMINRVGKWHGPAELRNIFCTRFKPADGIEGQGYCSIPGFTPGDIEAEKLSAPKPKFLPGPQDQRIGKLLPQIVKNIADEKGKALGRPPGGDRRNRQGGMA